MNKLFTYATPRPIGQFAMPVPAQNACMRDYALKNNFQYSLPILELMYDHCFAQLFRLLAEVPTKSNICMYSLYMLPLASSQKLRTVEDIILSKELLLHFVFENKIFSDFRFLKDTAFSRVIGEMVPCESEVEALFDNISSFLGHSVPHRSVYLTGETTPSNETLLRLSSQLENVGKELLHYRHLYLTAQAKLDYVLNPTVEKYIHCLEHISEVISEERILPDPLPDEDKLIFVHLTKTAGGTLQRMINLSGAGTYVCTSIENEVKGLTTDSLPLPEARKRIYCGHLVYNDSKTLLGLSNEAHFTILREPLLHLISHFNYTRLQGKDPNSVDAEALIAEFEMLVSSAVHLNYYCTVFNPNLSRDAANLLEFGTPYFSPLSQQDFEVALASLSSFLYVGIYEHFDKSVRVLFKRLGLEKIRYIGNRVHETPYLFTLKDLSQDVVRCAVDKMHYDFLIYKHFERVNDSISIR